jgi:hypothetical protein
MVGYPIQDCFAPTVRNQWFDLASKLNIISLNEVKDEVRWKLAGAENS